MLRITLRYVTIASDMMLLSRKSKSNRTTFDALSIIWRTSMQDWNGEAKGLLRAEMARRNMKAPDLAKKLEEIGVTERADNLKNKIARGQFSAAFLLQCLSAMGVKTIHLD